MYTYMSIALSSYVRINDLAAFSFPFFFFAICDAMRWMIYEIEFVCGIFMLIPSDLFLLEIRCSWIISMKSNYIFHVLTTLPTISTIFCSLIDSQRK